MLASKARPNQHSVYLADEQWRTIRQMAFDEEVTASEIVRRLVDQALARKNGKPRQERTDG